MDRGNGGQTQSSTVPNRPAQRERSRATRKENRNKNNANIGIAGVHYVVSELAIRGVIALPTIRNTAGYDIIATSEDGLWHANIQVKASAKPGTSWVAPRGTEADVRERFKHGPDDYYVLVRRVDETWETYLLTGQQAYENVLTGVKEQLLKHHRQPDKVWPYFSTKNSPHGRELWARAWKEWRQPSSMTLSQ